jgi:allantoicase
VQFGIPGTIRGVEVDTSWFKGNAPGSCSLEVLEAGDPLSSAAEWRQILPQVALRPDAVHRFEKEVSPGPPSTHARLNIFPDGGVARLRLFGTVA